jgi:hypothetical protein
MANNDPTPGIKNNYIRPDDADIILAYQHAGTGFGDINCPRCLREVEFAHRGNRAIACEEICLLCGRGGHKGMPCPGMYTPLFGKNWLDEHWVGHEKELSRQEVNEGLKFLVRPQVLAVKSVARSEALCPHSIENLPGSAHALTTKSPHRSLTDRTSIPERMRGCSTSNAYRARSDR